MAGVQTSPGKARGTSQALSEAGCSKGGLDSVIHQVFIKHLQLPKDPAANKIGKISVLMELTFYCKSSFF